MEWQRIEEKNDPSEIIYWLKICFCENNLWLILLMKWLRVLSILSLHIFTSISEKGGQKNGYHHDSATVFSLPSPLVPWRDKVAENQAYGFLCSRNQCSSSVTKQRVQMGWLHRLQHKCTQLNAPVSAEEKAEEHAEPWLDSFTLLCHSQPNNRKGEAACLHAIKKTWGLNREAGSQLCSFAFPCP